MVVQSDKGSETIVCYKTVYLTLINGHFSNATLYQPVGEDDIAGRDLDRMTSDLKDELTLLASRAPDQYHYNLIKSLLPTDSPRFPEGRINLKTHKPGITHTQIPVRPVISNIDAPTSVLAKYLGKCLTANLGLVSNKHVKSTEDFANFTKNCTTRGRILSLDVENLFSSIPREKIIRFLRDKSGGWGMNPPAEADPAETPLYSFEMDSKVFCDLVEVCLKYNQFHVGGKFYRQLQGLFMGSSISPPLAMMYMEYFEEYLYELNVPNDIKAKEWKRYVDDCFIVYEHGDVSFNRFFNMLNNLDPYIKFTYELAKPGIEIGLTGDVVEALPFLDLMVMRCLDRESDTLSNKLCIYRKPCHSGSYIHALSSQPTSTKRAVIRNMFLRGYRFCDSEFLVSEERKIYEDFGKLGYSKSFITKAKISAKQGRVREVRIRAGLEQQNPPRERSRFYLGLPYNRASCDLRYQFGLRGIDVAFTNRNSIKRHVTNKACNTTKNGVYILKCVKPSCESIYVGQSQDIPKRLEEHTRAKHCPSMKYYTSAKHTNLQQGHDLNSTNSLVPYRSSSLSHRLIIETSLISTCKTVKGNKASSCSRDMNIIAPIILKSAPIDWKVISQVQPSFNPEMVPKKYRRFFSPNDSSEIVTSSVEISSDLRTTEISLADNPRLPVTTHNYHLRSRANTSSSVSSRSS